MNRQRRWLISVSAAALVGAALAPVSESYLRELVDLCGRFGVRPAFVTDPAGADRLVFDPRCTQNLATYLSPRRGHVAKLGKAAVVVKG